MAGEFFWAGMNAIFVQSRSMIAVTCAIIEHKGKVLVAQRSTAMDLPLQWEFPGGKLQEGETEEACVVREIKEELQLRIAVTHRLPDCIYAYPTKTIRLIPFVCQLLEGHLHLAEHAQVQWLSPHQLPPLNWCEADVEVVEHYLQFVR